VVRSDSANCANINCAVNITNVMPGGFQRCGNEERPGSKWPISKSASRSVI
jgi:hypothetical protein